MASENDSVGRELDGWLDAMPTGVDPQVEAARQRIGRIGRHLDRILTDVATDHELTVGDWAALSAVHRLAPAGTCTPKELADALGVTSGTMTVRIERLIRSGFVESVAAEDQRSRPVRLTSSGLRAWSNATQDRTSRESAMFAAILDKRGLDKLNRLLAALLAGLETGVEPVSRHDIPRSH